MTWEAAGSGLAPSVQAYARASVEDFLAAAEAEKEQLRAAIAEAQARERRARASVGMHRVMVSMLLETQREIAMARERAEREATEIVASAEDEAAAIVQSARDEVASRSGPRVAPYPRRSSSGDLAIGAMDVDTAAVDLASAEHREWEEQRRPHPSRTEHPGVGASAVGGNGSAGDEMHLGSSAIGLETGEDERFFAYLRGALADDEPLGPRFA